MSLTLFFAPEKNYARTIRTSKYIQKVDPPNPPQVGGSTASTQLQLDSARPEFGKKSKFTEHLIFVLHIDKVFKFALRFLWLSRKCHFHFFFKQEPLPHAFLEAQHDILSGNTIFKNLRGTHWM